VNDYIGDSHEDIYRIVTLGQPRQLSNWAAGITGIRRELVPPTQELRDLLATVPETWSDGSGSERFSADLAAVVEYLEILGDGLSGLPASYSDLIGQAGSDLEAAQKPAALPPPPSPGLDTASLESDHALSHRVIADPVIRAQSDAAYTTKIAQAEAARLLAGATATTLDDHYRTVAARLTAPPTPPAVVLEAAGLGATVPESGADSDRPESMLRGGSDSGRALTGPSSGPYSPAVGDPAVEIAERAITPGGSGWAGISSVAAISVLPVRDRPDVAWVSLAGGVLAGAAGSVPRPAGDSAVLAGGNREDSAGPPPARIEHPSGKGPGSNAFAGPPVLVGRGSDPVTVAAITAGPGLSLTAPIGSGSSGQTVSGVEGFAVSAGGAAFLARGGSGSGAAARGAGVNANGLKGLGVGVDESAATRFSPSGVSPTGVNPSGVNPSGVNPSGVNGAAVQGGTTGTVSSKGLPANRGGAGFGRSAVVDASGGGVAEVEGSTKERSAGTTGVSDSSNSLVQGGPAGPAARPAPAALGYAAGRPAVPGSVIGGASTFRVTWLVEDRDLYAAPPSVAPVIGSPVEIE